MTPAVLLMLFVRIFLVALAALTLIRAVSGAICSRGLLKDPEASGTSAVRLQMLIMTSVTALRYVASVEGGPHANFPRVDPELLVFVAGSNSVSLLWRAFVRLRSFLRKPPPI